MIYLDYQATTPLAPEAREAMVRWLDGPDGTGFGNPHSPHRLGRMAAAAVDIAREQVAALFPPGGQVVFTSGATEAINLAMRGTVRAGDERPVAISAIEHAAVRDTAAALGVPVHELPVGDDGVVAADAPWPDATRLVALMQVNNEIGTVQPVGALAERARADGALMLCDAVQAAGRMPVAHADLISVSAHKLHGPKGIGALWVRDGVTLDPQITGGGQQDGMRSGTLSPALCTGFGAAAALAITRMEEDAAHVGRLFDRARAWFAGWTLNGSEALRWRGNLNLRRDGLDVARLMSEVREVAFSAGSACASGSGLPSHVLQAIGLTDTKAKQSIRLGFGRYTREEDLEHAAALIQAAAKQQGF
ncbi:cysteine desulfurase family protein [Croceicoccus sp. YJ47]|uniref:cysteine desulfurase family protein n=1 Tax=Croceicoccus sp. YJ47 TaxID=2798724 RepID=UPI0019251550|nr:cysteine desulfurase family protein [Croceicoccus sp. YJ47]QQN73638.1 cysteine desulfurase [Croceicoccus sp. YJ47]